MDVARSVLDSDCVPLSHKAAMRYLLEGQRPMTFVCKHCSAVFPSELRLKLKKHGSFIRETAPATAGRRSASFRSD